MFKGTDKYMPQWEKALKDEQIETVRYEYSQGVSTYKLAEKYYCCRETIWQYVKDIKNRHGISHRRLSETRVKQIREAYLLGTKVSQIAELAGVSRQTVFVYCRGLGGEKKRINRRVLVWKVGA